MSQMDTPRNAFSPSGTSPHVIAKPSVSSASGESLANGRTGIDVTRAAIVRSGPRVVAERRVVAVVPEHTALIAEPAVQHAAVDHHADVAAGREQLAEARSIHEILVHLPRQLVETVGNLELSCLYLDVPEITEVQEHVAPRAVAFQLAFHLGPKCFRKLPWIPIRRRDIAKPSGGSSAWENSRKSAWSFSLKSTRNMSPARSDGRWVHSIRSPCGWSLSLWPFESSRTPRPAAPTGRRLPRGSASHQNHNESPSRLKRTRRFLLSEGLRPSDSPTHSLARRFAGALLSCGSLAVARSRRRHLFAEPVRVRK